MTEAVEERKIGRPTKLTPEVQEKILTAIRAGNYSQVAARYAGIAESTFFDWMARGDRGEQPFAEFSEAVHDAEAHAEVQTVAHLRSHMPKEWKPCVEYLQRKHPERWGARAVSEGPAEGGQVVIREIVVRLPDQAAERFALPGVVVNGNGGEQTDTESG